MYKYKTKGVCSKEIDFSVEDNKITSLKFIGGCPGNTVGISHLVKDMDIDEVIEKLKGIKCGYKSTSCPDQLALALIQFKEENK